MFKRLSVLLCALLFTFDCFAMETGTSSRIPFSRDSLQAIIRLYHSVQNGFSFLNERRVPLGGSALCASFIMYISRGSNNENTVLSLYRGISSALIPTGMVYFLLAFRNKLNVIEEEVKKNGRKIDAVGKKVENAERNLGEKIDVSNKEQKERVDKAEENLGIKIDQNEEKNEMRHEELKRENALILANVEGLAQEFASSVGQARENGEFTQEKLSKLERGMELVNKGQVELSEDLKVEFEKQQATLLEANKKELENFRNEVSVRVNQSDTDAANRHREMKAEVSDMRSALEGNNEQLDKLEKGQKEAEKKREEGDRENHENFDQMRQLINDSKRETHELVEGLSIQQYQQYQELFYGNQRQQQELLNVLQGKHELKAIIEKRKKNKELVPTMYVLCEIKNMQKYNKDFFPDKEGFIKMINAGLEDQSMPKNIAEIHAMLREIRDGQNETNDQLKDVARPGAPVVIQSNNTNPLLGPLSPPSPEKPRVILLSSESEFDYRETIKLMPQSENGENGQKLPQLNGSSFAASSSALTSSFSHFQALSTSSQSQQLALQHQQPK